MQVIVDRIKASRAVLVADWAGKKEEIIMPRVMLPEGIEVGSTLSLELKSCEEDLEIEGGDEEVRDLFVRVRRRAEDRRKNPRQH